jgi:ferric-dicitrate binding protein FerR (iron transport regulator)
MGMKNQIPWDVIIPHLKDTANADENNRFEEWVGQDDHRTLFAEIERLWDDIRTDAADYNPDTKAGWQRLQCRIEHRSHTTAQRTKPIHSLFTSLFWWKGVAAASLLLALVLAAALFHTPHTNIETKYTCQAGKSYVVLQDGSKVYMHNQTSMSYLHPTAKGDRLLRLQGEACFDIAHDEERPFVVQTDGMRITVHGTKFNVESFPDEHHTYVSLVRGSVSLDTEQGHALLHPGETAVYDRRNHDLSIRLDDVKFASSWANEQLAFVQHPLGEICRYLAKWYNVDIKVDPHLANRYRYTFTLQNESLEEILRIMKRIHPQVNYSFDEDNALSIYTKLNNPN